MKWKTNFFKPRKIHQHFENWANRGHLLEVVSATLFSKYNFLNSISGF